MSQPAPVAFPYPHFMGLAPLDVWLRLLLRPPVRVPPRYWPRLALALATSLIVTALTLPERLLTAAWLRLRPRRKLPGPVVILGYYRSGTTFLQYLLGGDPHLYSPHWGQAFAPQGYVLTWSLVRWFVLPFLPRTRPQDNVSFGPLVPAEDDFALNNWALASTLPGRVVVPRDHAFYDRFHDLKRLTPAELARWRRYQLAFVRKLAPLAAGRRVLLKTPAHTARLPELLELFRDTTGVKFIYITRHPHKVFRSNVAMLRLLAPLAGLQPPLPEAELEGYLLDEFVGTEEEFQRTRGLVPEGSLAEMRLQDLQADPVGEVRRAYEQLGLAFTPELERHIIEYQRANRDYQPNVHPPWTAEQQEQVLPRLEPLIDAGRHREPARPAVPLPPPGPGSRRRQVTGGVLAGAVAAVACVAAWLGLARWVGADSLGFVWLCGVLIGRSVLRGAGDRGSAGLGIYAAALTALTLGAVAAVANWWLPDQVRDLPAYLLYGCVWWLLGLASAYRIGSQ